LFVAIITYPMMRYRFAERPLFFEKKRPLGSKEGV
jgi:hypothetical protein